MFPSCWPYCSPGTAWDFATAVSHFYGNSRYWLASGQLIVGHRLYTACTVILTIEVSYAVSHTPQTVHKMVSGEPGRIFERHKKIFLVTWLQSYLLAHSSYVTWQGQVCNHWNTYINVSLLILNVSHVCMELIYSCLLGGSHTGKNARGSSRRHSAPAKRSWMWGAESTVEPAARRHNLYPSHYYSSNSLPYQPIPSVLKGAGFLSSPLPSFFLLPGPTYTPARAVSPPFQTGTGACGWEGERLIPPGPAGEYGTVRSSLTSYHVISNRKVVGGGRGWRPGLWLVRRFDRGASYQSPIKILRQWEAGPLEKNSYDQSGKQD
jgi:hypothetical protein